jgi:hypothetical protein
METFFYYILLRSVQVTHRARQRRHCISSSAVLALKDCSMARLLGNLLNFVKHYEHIKYFIATEFKRLNLPKALCLCQGILWSLMRIFFIDT